MTEKTSPTAYEICGQNCEPSGSGSFSPCLRPKGHKGVHMHKALCNSPCCMCGSIFARFTPADKEVYDKLQRIKNEMDMLSDSILSRYAR